MRGALLVWRFTKVALLNELQYRVNFWLSLLQSAISLGVGLIVLALVFRYVDQLAGWTRPELYLVLGMYTALGGVSRMAIKPNMLQLLSDVRDGALDYVLTKPVDGQLLVSTRRLQPWQGVDVVVGGLVVGWGLAGLTHPVGPAAAAAFLLTFLLGVVLLYCLLLSLSVSVFWFVRVDAMIEVFDAVFQAGRYPVGIYPGWLRIILSALVPVGFAVTVPSEALAARLTATTLLLVVALAAGWVGLSRWLWRRGLRRYSGASA
ncbi:MAG: ABC transporter permease [Micromonosporaceae bacterium]|nr:ABC transporter permease [Micromonosporaceae bacterium]